VKIVCALAVGARASAAAIDANVLTVTALSLLVTPFLLLSPCCRSRVGTGGQQPRYDGLPLATLSLRTPRSGDSVANLVAHQIDMVRDKVCDMVFRSLKTWACSRGQAET